jgi:hypothetical protein
MKTKKTLLAMAAAALALMALPALAAANPHLEIEEGGSGHFEFAGETIQWSTVGGNAFHCESVSGTGEFIGNPSKTGEIEFLFHGCKSSGFACTSSGQSSGDVAVEATTFHLVTATHEPEGEKADGILITPKGHLETGEKGEFINFKCAFGLVSITVTGTGVIGEITEPETNEASSTFKVSFTESSTGVQTYRHISEDANEYDLTAKVGGGEYETTSLVGETTGHFTEESQNKLINTGA